MKRFRVIVVAGFALLAALVVGIALYLAGDDEQPSTRPTVTWGGSEGHPSCAYDQNRQVVHAKLTIDGRATRPVAVSVTVTAYADENTSEPVGSGRLTARIDGTVHRRLAVVFPVDRPPKVDVDGETACRLSVKYSDRSQSR